MSAQLTFSAINRMRQWFRRPRWPIVLLLLLTAYLTLLLWRQPAQALQVQLSPSAPKLGDTIVVVARLNVPPGLAPTIQVEQKSYPMFPLRDNLYRGFVPTTPLDKPRTLPIQVIAGNETRSLPLRLANRSFPVQRIWLPPGRDDLGTDLEFDRVAAFKRLITPEKLWRGPLLRPNAGEITAGYGIRRYYNGEFAEDYYHRGIDYGGDTGSPVITPAAGRVVLVGRESQGFELHGNTVGVDHGQGLTSIFLHLSRIDVKEGDVLKAGQRVGAVGDTGAVTGPHLHWGLYVNGQSIDPVPWRTQTID